MELPVLTVKPGYPAIQHSNPITANIGYARGCLDLKNLITIQEKQDLKIKFVWKVFFLFLRQIK